MHPLRATRTSAKILLIAGLVGINAFPFITNSRTPYEAIFFALSAIHAQLCLLTAWLVFAERGRRHRRVVGCLLGAIASLVAATRLLPGQWTQEQPWQSLLLGLGATVPAALPMAAVLAAQRWYRGTELLTESASGEPFGRFRLRHLFGLIVGCAFLSLLLRQLIRSPAGWLASPADASAAVMAVVQSCVIGLIAAPCALVVLKPNRFAPLWLAYFLVVVALQPLLDVVLRGIFDRPKGLTSQELIWPESYLSAVVENITWYGPQLLPTVALFVLLRMSGVHVRETSPQP
jgi:hypothetical protein